MTVTRCVKHVVVLSGLLVGSMLQPVWAQEWIDKPVIAAAERVFSAMPDDYFGVRPAVAQKEMSGEGTLVLDVREAAEFKAERIAAAKNIPIRQLARVMDTLPQNRAAPIIVYCRSGHRGAIALTVLRMAGYTNVRSLTGGLEAWKAAGLPLTQ